VRDQPVLTRKQPGRTHLDLIRLDSHLLITDAQEYDSVIEHLLVHRDDGSSKSLPVFLSVSIGYLQIMLNAGEITLRDSKDISIEIFLRRLTKSGFSEGFKVVVTR
jgi:hypothetical protein